MTVSYLDGGEWKPLGFTLDSALWSADSDDPVDDDEYVLSTTTGVTHSLSFKMTEIDWPMFQVVFNQPPFKAKWCQGKRYRIARRKYGRALRASRRGVS